MAKFSGNPKPPVEVAAEFTSALRRDREAAKAYAALSPSCQREYVEWIAEGKQRNWTCQAS